MSQKERELRAKITGKIAQAETLQADKTKNAEFLMVVNELSELNAELKNIIILDESKRALDEPVVKNKASKKLFNSFGEFCQAVARTTGPNPKRDERLDQISNVMTGATDGQNTTVGADGGYLVDTDFLGELMDRATRRNRILQLTTSYTTSSNANQVRWWRGKGGLRNKGVTVAWTNEGELIQTSKLQFEEVKLDLEKLTGAAYVTNEMLEDAPFIESIVMDAFVQEISDKRASAIINGTGTGQPLGFLNSGALIEIARPASQTTFFTYANLVDMFESANPGQGTNYVWLMHPDVKKAIRLMKFEEVPGAMPVYLPAGGASGFPYDTLFGREIIEDDECPGINQKGCINFVDFRAYIELKKGTIRQDWSAHVEFLRDSMTFRIVMRLNGMPAFNLPNTLKNSENKRSEFITMAASSLPIVAPATAK